MCQDTDHRVRLSMGGQLGKIARLLKKEKSNEDRMQALCEELIELLRDEEAEVDLLVLCKSRSHASFTTFLSPQTANCHLAILES